MILFKTIIYCILIQSYFVYFLYPNIEFKGNNFRIINDKVVNLGLKEKLFKIKLTIIIFILSIATVITNNYIIIPFIFFVCSFVFYFKLSNVIEELKHRIGVKYNLIRFFPYLSGAKHEKIALEYYQDKEYIKAIVIYDYYIQRRRNKIGSTIISFLEMRAQCLDILGYHLDAIDDYKTVLRIQPNGNNYGLLAMCYYQIGNWEECVINLKRSAEYGSKVFSPMYSTFNNLSQDAIEEIKLRSAKLENLKRRYNWDWVEVLECGELISMEEDNFKYAKKQILKYLEFDPDNKNLKKLLTQCNCNGLWYDSGYSIDESEIMNTEE